MIALEMNQYDLIKPMLAEIPGCLWNVDVLEKRKLGNVYVDRLPYPQATYIETPYFLYYAGGVFNKVFLDDVINHILADLIPDNEARPVFLFSTSQEWKDEIEKRLTTYNRSDFGPYLTRRLHHLNKDSYEKFKKSLLPLPDEYTVIISHENGESIVRAYCNDIEVCACHDGGQGLGLMDFNVFTHPYHRHKGLASICCSKLIDHCIEQDIVPQWGCWTVNVPSCNLAEKLGFQITAETQVNFAEIKKE
ncbi:GNAT family N-acetyltransferase [Paenibacillus sp. 7124]|uniref:GNAT family N-acetyltransferase n=1 Tax=Paenibacillus apii TaxID=1850370 RepID=A0A6M1PCK2_9BACL|nr:GNAT family N-acetyltransferase [Paenibacillus apii]NGM80937.1 GNAT family N-acetyltransferase [Paenibacillus apii]